MDREDETGEPVDQAVLWPREEDYPRFVEVCTDKPVATYAEFVARAQPHVDALRAEGFNVLIVEPDPVDMAAWCRANFGKVDTAARAAYAAVVALSEPTDKDSIN
jgi:hypothetical protein